MIFFLLTTVVACGDAVKEGIDEFKNVFDVKSDVNNYLPQREILIKKDIILMETFYIEFMEEEDWDQAYNGLVSLINEYSGFLKEVKSVEVATDEVKEVHDEYINATSLTLDSFTVYEKYMVEEREALWVEAENLMNEAIYATERHDEMLLEVADEYL